MMSSLTYRNSASRASTTVPLPLRTRRAKGDCNTETNLPADPAGTRLGI
jgi:hypothetical protein